MTSADRNPNTFLDRNGYCLGGMTIDCLPVYIQNLKSPKLTPLNSWVATLIAPYIF